MAPVLEVERLSKRFGGLQVFHDVSFAVEPGEIVGLIGPNGAGKTTLFNVITGFLPPEAGTVRFAGLDLTARRPDRVCQAGLARTFQIPRPFSRMSVLENVTTAALIREAGLPAARAIAAELLERLDLARHADVEARLLNVAGRKRLEVARALATQPRMLLLDEVMGGLNPSEVQRTVELVRSLVSEGLTILLVEHIMAAVMTLSHRVLVLHQGQLLADGPPASVARDERVVKAYLGEEYSFAPRA